MASLNRVFLMGNLTRDPELRYLPSGTAVTSFSIAVNRVYKSATGEKQEEVCFVRITVWGKQAESCNQYLSKGKSVFIEGRLQYRAWQTPDGSKRSALEVNANRVQFLGAPGAPREGVTPSTAPAATDKGGGEIIGEVSKEKDSSAGDLPF